jgi:hypothetical protein
MANQYKTQTEAILEILGGNTSSTKPAAIIEDRAKIAKVAIERLDEAMGYYASHKDGVRGELKSITETINKIINED